MTGSTVLISSWTDGVFVLSADRREHELAGRPVAALAPDGRSGAIGIVAERTLARRSPRGDWSDLATSAQPMECCLAVGGVIYAGTEGAHLLRFREGAGFSPVEGFEATAGRETWFAGSAVVDGVVMGPPLSVRAMAASRDGGVLLAAVHVGGIVRSVDGGATWHPTAPIEWDVHDVAVHPEDPHVAVAAAGAGLCVSRDGGATWAREDASPTATYCSAVACVGEDAFVAVSTDHFAPYGMLRRRSVAASGVAEDVVDVSGGGLPDRLDGIVDTRCLAARGSELVAVDAGGHVYWSDDRGRHWTRLADGIPHPSAAVIV
jgi:hypothetical protein